MMETNIHLVVYLYKLIANLARSTIGFAGQLSCIHNLCFIKTYTNGENWIHPDTYGDTGRFQ